MILLLIFLTLSATLRVKSGLSTLNNISGLNLIISSTVLLILFLILKIFNKTLVKPIYVISLRSKIDFIPSEFKCVPPTQEYSMSGFLCLSLDITVEASLSPDGSPVKINIYFI